MTREIDFIKLYDSDRKSFARYAKMFQKENPHLDLFTCEMILRTPVDRIDKLLDAYESGEIVDDTEGGKSFVIESATIHHPDDGDVEPRPIEVSVERI